MPRNRGNGDPFSDFGDPFAGFGGFGAGPAGFGGQRSSMLSNFFGGRDPFDDPFFQRPFGNMFGRNMFGPSVNPFVDGPAPGFLEHRMPQPAPSRRPVIEELSSDDEGDKEDEEKRGNPRKHARSSNVPYVEDPDDVTDEGRSKQMQYMNNFNRANNAHSQPHTQSYTFQSSSVTYGGVDGAYYTSSSTRRTGSDGLTFEESKEADTTRGEASHRVSRGLHDKGHTVNRKLNSDGRVHTMQMLHNLNEDELSGFDEVWNGNARKRLPGWNEGLNVNGGEQTRIGTGGGVRRALPSIQHSGSMGVETNGGAGTSQPQQFSNRTEPALVNNGARTSRGRSGRSGAAINKDHTRNY